MTKKDGIGSETAPIDTRRRDILTIAGAGALAATFSSVLTGVSSVAEAAPGTTLRWGFVGTGRIANQMAPMVKLAANAELVAVSSRKMETAKAFADKRRPDFGLGTNQ